MGEGVVVKGCQQFFAGNADLLLKIQISNLQREQNNGFVITFGRYGSKFYYFICSILISIQFDFTMVYMYPSQHDTLFVLELTLAFILSVRKRNGLGF